MSEDRRTDVEEIVETQEIDDEEGYERYCFLCHRPESVTGKLIDMPNNMAVCQDCMKKSFDTMMNSSIDFSQLMNMPGVQFLNLADMEHMMPKRQKVKKKKPEKKAEPVFDIKNIPAPHKIKEQLELNR